MTGKCVKPVKLFDALDRRNSYQVAMKSNLNPAENYCIIINDKRNDEAIKYYP
jgi:hypothetical protein